MSDPSRIKVFRKVIDRQSGKPLYELTKFKIVRVTDHTYVTDTGKVYRKNHICLKPNYRSTVSVAPNNLGDRLQVSNATSVSRDTAKGPATRPQLVLLSWCYRWWTSQSALPAKAQLALTVVCKWLKIPLLSINVRGFRVTHLRSDLLLSLTPHRSPTPTDSTERLNSSLTSPQTRTSHCAASPSTAHLTNFLDAYPSRSGITPSSADMMSPQGLVLPSHSKTSELPSSYPSLSLPAQPVVDDAESVRTSHRSKKPTQFFANP